MGLIPDRSKFAALALETNRVAASIPDALELPSGFLAVRHLPLPLPGHWLEWHGTLTIGRIEAEGLYLFAHTPDPRPEIDDSRNEDLRKSVSSLYWSLVLSAPFFSHERGIMLTGYRDKNELRIQGTQEYPRLPWTPWAPRQEVDETCLRDAVGLSLRIAALLKVASFERLARANRIFYDGLQTLDLGVRTLAFVRTTEAFLLPPVGRAKETFIERTKTFVGEGQGEALSQMYDIRSAVVHLHDPTQLLPQVGKRGRGLLLLRRCIQAEALARFCLSRLPERPAAYPFFQDDQTLGNFWKLDSEQRGSLWGTTLDLEHSLSEVRDAWVDDETLGM